MNVTEFPASYQASGYKVYVYFNSPFIRGNPDNGSENGGVKLTAGAVRPTHLLVFHVEW